MSLPVFLDQLCASLVLKEALIAPFHRDEIRVKIVIVLAQIILAEHFGDAVILAGFALH
jgi:hypothetical protein